MFFLPFAARPASATALAEIIVNFLLKFYSVNFTFVLSYGMSEFSNKLRIGVMGIGGAGSNAVNLLIKELSGIDFWVCNTDQQSLSASKCDDSCKIPLGERITKGKGAGANPEVGRAAAEDTIEEIMGKIKGLDMVILIAGGGGGTGSGATPVIARAARQSGILTLAIVTKPFLFEGTQRMAVAEQAIKEIQSEVDTMVVISNQNLISASGPNTTFLESFEISDRFLCKSIDSICRIVMEVGLVNADFADFCAVTKDRKSRAMMGNGYAEGENAGARAMEEAMSSFLLDMTPGYGWENVDSVILCIRGGQNLGTVDVEAASEAIKCAVSPDANMIVGANIVPSMVKKDQNGNEIKAVEVFVLGTTGKGVTSVPASVTKKQKSLWTDYKSDAEYHGNPHALHEKTSAYTAPTKKRGILARWFGYDEPEVKELPDFIPKDEE